MLGASSLVWTLHSNGRDSAVPIPIITCVQSANTTINHCTNHRGLTGDSGDLHQALMADVPTKILPKVTGSIKAVTSSNISDPLGRPNPAPSHNKITITTTHGLRSLLISRLLSALRRCLLDQKCKNPTPLYTRIHTYLPTCTCTYTHMYSTYTYIHT